jgi:hypothetical protein
MWSKMENNETPMMAQFPVQQATKSDPVEQPYPVGQYPGMTAAKAAALVAKEVG